ncbi:MAG: hypothetical protein ACOVNU_04160 [Candidatus Kapaibacteriota bacterium]
MKLFETEDDAITWVASNIALGVEPKKKAKTQFVSPYTSTHAHIIVVKHLGKELFKYQQEKIKP